MRCMCITLTLCRQSRVLPQKSTIEYRGDMATDINPHFNILITDHTSIEWLATLFHMSLERHSPGSIKGTTRVKWRTQPSWTQRPHLPLQNSLYEISDCTLSLYSVPSAARREFKLTDLDLSLDGGVIILDLGNTKLWQRHASASIEPVQVWEDDLKNAIELHLHRTQTQPHDRIWGVDLLNQINGPKLIVGIRRGADCVNPSAIVQFVGLNPPVHTVFHDVDSSSWLDIDDSFPGPVIDDILNLIAQLLGCRPYSSVDIR